VLLADAGDEAGAVEASRQAVRADPDDATARYNLADALDDAGRGSDAAEQFAAYLRQEPFPSPNADHARKRIGSRP
jgi:thioredoxin-like negative regulator of GroEL